MKYLYNKIDLLVKLTLIMIGLCIFYMLVAISFKEFQENLNIPFLIFSCSLTLILCILIAKLKSSAGIVVIIASFIAIYCYSLPSFLDFLYIAIRNVYIIYGNIYSLLDHLACWLVESICWIVGHPKLFAERTFLFVERTFIIICLVLFAVLGILVMSPIIWLFSKIFEPDEDSTRLDMASYSEDYSGRASDRKW